jgi:rSAM/selenodomain-associated transferase 2
MISIIIPTLNEEKIIRSTLENLSLFTRGRSYEIIVSDGGSQDYTVKIAKQYAKIVISKKGKAIQLNTGAKKAKGKILFFLPADITVPDGALEAIERKIFKQGYDGGGFSNVFSNYNNKIKTLGRIMNLRIFDNDNKRNLIFYGDNGIFCKKEVFNRLRGFKRIPIMEDYDFSKRMRENSKTVRIMHPRLILSPRRHISNGFVRTRFQWITIKRLYLLGVSPHILEKMYSDIR